MSEKELQKELELRREYNCRIKSFVEKMSKVSTVINLNKKSEKQTQLAMSNNMLCCRYENDQGLSSPAVKRKRKTMETSTPVSERRETQLIDLGEDSPIGTEVQNGSTVTDDSGDIIPTEKVKAGLSNDVDSMVVTPPKEISPGTMDKRLALHCIDLVNASVNNVRVLEMREQEVHTLNLSENSFSKKSNGTKSGDQAVGMDGMNKIPSGKRLESSRAVGVDGMNKTPLGEKLECNRAVGMDDMNKTPIGGGNGEVLVNDANVAGGNNRKILVGGRRLSVDEMKKVKKGTSSQRLYLGKKATGDILSSRACPDGCSPKRTTPMDIDPSPLSKKKKRENAKKPKTVASRIILPQNQQRLTDLWKSNNVDTDEEQ